MRSFEPLKKIQVFKKRKCKNCLGFYLPENEREQKQITPLCGYHCAIELVRKNDEKNRDKKIKTERKEWHEKNDKLSVFEKKLESEINHIVRLIDYGQGCISCDSKEPKKLFAGHYHSVGSNKTIRYHLDNIHGQCFSCNGKKGGNIIGYNKGLIEWYGKDYKEYVESTLVREHKLLKLTRSELNLFTLRARSLRKELEKANQIYDSALRLEVRSYYNNELKIY